MNNFTLTPSISDKIFRFGILYGRISALKYSGKWFKKLTNVSIRRAAIAAVSLDKSIFEKIDLDLLAKKANFSSILKVSILDDYNQYLAAKSYLKTTQQNKFSLEFLNEMHAVLLKKENRSIHFRTSKRLLPKQITENGIVKNVTLEVLTLPHQIPQKLQNYLDWFEMNINSVNPIILAAINHFRIAEIHPFDDGNGRLCRLLDYYILAKNNIDIDDMLALECYFLIHSERYYQLIESTIESQDLTQWIEFYTDALLNSILETSKIISKLTAGAVDIQKNRIHDLSELEIKIIELMQSTKYPTPLEMANILGYSKQNICRILRELAEKGIIQKVGKNTGVRYHLI